MKKLICVTALCLLIASSASALQKNAASQVICAELTSKNDGNIITSGTTSVYVTGDNVQSAGTGTISHRGQGMWCYQPTQAETNFNHVAYTFTNTNAITTAVQVYPGNYNNYSFPVMQGSVYSAVMTQNSTLVIVRGDSPRLQFDLGANYAGWTPQFAAQSYPKGSSYAIGIKTGSWTDATTGKGYIDLSKTDTNIAAVSYDAELTLINGTQKLTAIKYTLKIIPNIIP